jgi:hypothetical protein
MVTALPQRASHAGHRFSSAHAQPGSPLAIFSGFASGIGLLLVTGSMLASVAYLAHLINTSWQLL